MRVVMLLAAGCGYVERQKEICHPETGCLPRPFWMDADGDGWGTGDAGAPDAVEVDAPEGMAGNVMDCDDGDSSITGDVGGLCPARFTVGADPVGVVEGDRERVLLVAGAPLDAGQASDVCGTPGWGGAIGGAPSDLAANDPDLPVWLASAPGELGPAWDGFPGRDELGDAGFVRWIDGRLEVADPSEGGLVGCERPAPDPRDYQVPAEAP